ncbi:PspC domain-containing protein [Nocardioides sp.]|uniref:PspC domain-containing protein n=1 Tax=Nocardioides sp. TaxID=35761 RepID=UPI00356239E2
MSTDTPIPPAAGPRRLTRNTDDRMVAGLCSGLADYFDVDVTLVRVLTVVLAVLSLCSAVLAYLVAWVLVPRA